MAFVITDGCVACGSCAGACPVGAITEGDGAYVIDENACVACGTCAGRLPHGCNRGGLILSYSKYGRCFYSVRFLYAYPAAQTNDYPFIHAYYEYLFIPILDLSGFFGFNSVFYAICCLHFVSWGGMLISRQITEPFRWLRFSTTILIFTIFGRQTSWLTRKRSKK